MFFEVSYIKGQAGIGLKSGFRWVLFSEGLTAQCPPPKKMAQNLWENEEKSQSLLIQSILQWSLLPQTPKPKCPKSSLHKAAVKYVMLQQQQQPIDPIFQK